MTPRHRREPGAALGPRRTMDKGKAAMEAARRAEAAQDKALADAWPDADPPPTCLELTGWIAAGKDPSAVADTAERLGKLYELDGVTIQRLVVLGLVVKDSDGVQAAFDLVGIIEDAEEANSPNPLAPMVNAMLKARSTSAGAAMVLVDKSGANLTRYPTPGATATLATWEDSEILAVHVDGAPIASAEPLWRVKPSSVQRPGTQLALLPGDSQAASMISQRMAAIERTGIDRRGVLAADTFWLLNLACALTRPLKVSIDELAAWLAPGSGCRIHPIRSHFWTWTPWAYRAGKPCSSRGTGKATANTTAGIGGCRARLPTRRRVKGGRKPGAPSSCPG